MKEYNVRFWFWHSPTAFRNWPQRAGGVVCGENFNWTKFKTMRGNVDACMTLVVKMLSQQGQGVTMATSPPPDAPSPFFASAEISGLRLSRPSQRSQEPSLRSEKLIGIGFVESECTEKLGARRIWVRHKTCRAAVHLRALPQIIMFSSGAPPTWGQQLNLISREREKFKSKSWKNFFFQLSHIPTLTDSHTWPKFNT